MCIKLNIITFLITIAGFVMYSSADKVLNSRLVCYVYEDVHRCKLGCHLNPEDEVLPCEVESNKFSQCYTLRVGVKFYRRCYDKYDNVIENYCLIRNGYGIHGCNICKNDEEYLKIAPCIDAIFSKMHSNPVEKHYLAKVVEWTWSDFGISIVVIGNTPLLEYTKR